MKIIIIIIIIIIITYHLIEHNSLQTSKGIEERQPTFSPPSLVSIRVVDVLYFINPNILEAPEDYSEINDYYIDYLNIYYYFFI